MRCKCPLPKHLERVGKEPRRTILQVVTLHWASEFKVMQE